MTTVFKPTIKRVYPSDQKKVKQKKRRRNALCESMISDAFRYEMQLLSLSLHNDEVNNEMKAMGEGEEKLSACEAKKVQFRTLKLDECIFFLNQTKKYRYESFDIHEFFALATNEYVLPAIAMSIFYDLDAQNHFLNDLNIDSGKLQNYIVAISRQYIQTNHFHNALHAADVGQTLYSLLYGNKNLSNRLSKLDQFTMLLSAFVHDVGHNGTNNDFLIKTNSPLALRYNDQSILENFHISTAWETITSKDEHNFMQDMTTENKQRFRKLLIKVILATDNSKHFEKLNQLKQSIYSGLQATPCDTNTNQLLYKNKDFIMEVLLHAADISNPAKTFRIYGRWVDKIMEEFYALGDLEKLHNVALTEIFKRGNSRAKVQHGFLKYFVQPLFVSINENIDGINVNKMLQNIQHNMDHWEKLMME
jgi:hypothetical protein